MRRYDLSAQARVGGLTPEENAHIMTHIAPRRLALGLTQDDLAHILGVARNTLVRWESGYVSPQCPRVLDLALRCLEQYHHPTGALPEPAITRTAYGKIIRSLRRQLTDDLQFRLSMAVKQFALSEQEEHDESTEPAERDLDGHPATGR